MLLLMSYFFAYSANLSAAAARGTGGRPQQTVVLVDSKSATQAHHRSPNDARTVSRVERTRPKAATGSSSGRANSRRIDEKSGRVGRLLANLNAAASNPLSRLRSTKGSWFAHEDINRKAQAAAKAAGIRPDYKLTFWGCMVAGAVSRSVAQTALHPANVIKTLLQTKGSFNAIFPLTWGTLSRGAGAQFLLSLPNGALHFAVLENTKARMAELLPARSATFLLDFVSCSAATAFCSVMSTPQMVLTNRIMAGVYPNLFTGVRSVIRETGVKGFYAGWWPGLVQKIPSYGLTWVLFQQVKDLHYKMAKRLPTNGENFWLGSCAAAGSVTIMIPMDTVKTRLVTQAAGSKYHYTGIINCFTRMLRDEGIGSFYNSLTPRLVSVVPMIGVQYFVYEFMKKLMAEVPEVQVNRAADDAVLARTKVVEELETVTDG